MGVLQLSGSNWIWPDRERVNVLMFLKFVVREWIHMGHH